jgi:hypothetical protein
LPAKTTVVLDPVVEGHHVEQVQVLTLVLVDPLDLDVEQRGRVDHHPGPVAYLLRQPPLVVGLDPDPPLLEAGLVREADQPLQPGQVLGPALADGLVEEPAQLRVAEQHEAARGHPVGLVGELLRPQLEEVMQDIALEQLGVQGGHAVDGLAADAGQVRHPHPLVARLVDQRQA